VCCRELGDTVVGTQEREEVVAAIMKALDDVVPPKLG
jgi:hypothetical protein